MAKSAGKASGAGSRKASDKTSATRNKAKSPKAAPRKAVIARGTNASQGSEDGQGSAAVEMFLKLLQSPIVADLLAVAATAALAALAEHGFNRGGGSAEGKRAGKAVKAAGKAAAAAIGRRLANEVGEIRKAANAKSAEA